MKSLLFSILIFNLGFAQTFDWEWLNPTPTGNDHNDVIVFSSGKLMTFSAGSYVYTSTNNGSSWSFLQADTAARDIYEAVFTDNNNGYLCGLGNLLMKTTDGGASWNYMQSPAASTIAWWYIDFPSATTGYAVGSSGIVIKTTDAGATWNFATSPGNALIYKIFMLDNNTGYIGLGSSTVGRLLKTTDGGTSWQNITANVPFTASPIVRGIYFIDADTGYISTSNSEIFKTTNAGTNWVSAGIFASGTIYEVKFRSASTGFAAAGSGVVLKTTDFGASWVQTPSVGTQNVFGLSVAPNLNETALIDEPIFVGGSSGDMAISTDNGTSWTLLNKNVTLTAFRRIQFISPTVGFAVGGTATEAPGNGLIFKTVDAGLTWTALTPVNYLVYSQYWINESTGFVGTRGPTGLFKTTDGGQSWTGTNTGSGATTTILYDINFTDANNGIVVYANGTSSRTNDGGNSWASVTTNFATSTIYDIATTSNAIYIAGGSSKVGKSTDGGATFVQTAVPVSAVTLYSIDFANENLGFIAGSTGRIFRTTDAGATWTLQTTPTTSTLYSVKAVSSNIIWAAGASGTTIYSTDAGVTWERSPVFAGGKLLYEINSFSTGYIYACGLSGTIIRGLADPFIPVELTSFTASINGKEVLLNWTTATETNNLGFEIQRSISGADFSRIGFVDGQGSTTTPYTYSFSDFASSFSKASYRLKQVDLDGSFTYSEVIEVDLLPFNFNLSQNFPNPFNPSTKISFSIPQNSIVNLAIYDISGQKVNELINNKEFTAGVYTIDFDAGRFTSGVYFYKLEAGGFSEVKKMTLLK
ncbi:MAG: T9SS type A sorting domain-containing protein [Ignavibacteriaceae bacterium]|nr:T9SS type A sorting domain-containing protein [Ignavibacteriaceae bacterium]